MAASRRRIATEVPSSRSMASRGPRTTSASACAVPRWRRRRSRSAGRSSGVAAGPRMATRILDVATTPGSVVRTCPRRRRSASIPPTSRAVRPPATAVTGAPRTWTSRMRSVSSPGTSRSVVPVVTVPPRRLPVTTVPRPLTANTRSIARRGPRASAAAVARREAPGERRDGRQHAVDPRAARRGRREHRRPGQRRRREQGRGPRPRPTRARASSTRSAFVTTASPSRIPSASRSPRCSSVCAFGPSSAATTSSAASISPAPTSMLPTRRSCPGTSTKSTTDPSGSATCA